MQLGITTSSHGRVLRGEEIYFTCEQALKAYKQSGFDVVGVDFYEYTAKEHPFNGANWVDWCQRQRDVAERIDIDIRYAHAPIYEGRGSWEADTAYVEHLTRSIEAAAMLGAKYMVLHPISMDDQAWYSHKNSLKKNVQIYRRFADICAQKGMLLCTENMIEPIKGRRFGSGVEELLELVEQLGNTCGICWDFGHAHIAGIDQRAALEQMGKRLVMLHVNDNYGNFDHHLTPYAGTIQWEEMMKTLKTIGYTGDLLFENFGSLDGLPEALRLPALAFLKQVGEYMVDIFENDSRQHS